VVAQRDGKRLLYHLFAQTLEILLHPLADDVKRVAQGKLDDLILGCVVDAIFANEQL
jgi:hypothetical protein